jgi:hypothetical protein
MPNHRPPRVAEPRGEHVLLAMLAAALMLVGSIAAAQMPEAIGAAAAHTALVAVAAAIGGLVAGLLRHTETP